MDNISNQKPQKPGPKNYSRYEVLQNYPGSERMKNMFAQILDNAQEINSHDRDDRGLPLDDDIKFFCENILQGVSGEDVDHALKYRSERLFEVWSVGLKAMEKVRLELQMRSPILKDREDELANPEFRNKVETLVSLVGTANNLVYDIKSLLEDLKHNDNFIVGAAIVSSEENQLQIEQLIQDISALNDGINIDELKSISDQVKVIMEGVVGGYEFDIVDDDN